MGSLRDHEKRCESWHGSYESIDNDGRRPLMSTFVADYVSWAVRVAAVARRASVMARSHEHGCVHKIGRDAREDRD